MSHESSDSIAGEVRAMAYGLATPSEVPPLEQIGFDTQLEDFGLESIDVLDLVYQIRRRYGGVELFPEDILRSLPPEEDGVSDVNFLHITVRQIAELIQVQLNVPSLKKKTPA